MKKILLPVFVLMSLVSFSQVKKKTTTPVPAQPLLKTTADSLSYAIGVSVAGFYREQGVKNVNTNLVARAINDALKNGKPLLNDQQCNAVIIGYVQKEKAAKSSENRKEGEAFLVANKTKPGITTLPSGLQYEVLKQGDGLKPLLTDKVKCHYKGSLIDGTVFESSIERGQPIEFAVNGVIAGWTEALQLMPVGSKWRLFIPSNLGYGDQGAGQSIKPGATLIFEVELLDIVK
jgi:FKBP-type peptidyl-prolyl cis-trans isomerase FklB